MHCDVYLASKHKHHDFYVLVDVIVLFTKEYRNLIMF